VSRCDAPPGDLDREGARWRSQEKTDFLISTWDPGTLWTDFGVCADILVCFMHSSLISKIEAIFIAIHLQFPLGRHP
jgi:hypothetical protein